MYLFELLFSVCFVVVLLRIYAWSMRTDRRVRPHPWMGRDRGSAGPARDPVASRPVLVPAAHAGDGKEPAADRAEAILVARRLAGELAPDDYRRAMAALAARDTTVRRFLSPRDHDA